MHQQYGYCRVSSKEQNTDRQLHALQEAGILRKNIFTDKISGKDFERPRYKTMLRRMRKGDTLVILSIDRLGRNYDEIIEQWRFLTKEKEIDIVVLDMPLLDTRQKEKDLTGTFIADLVLQILSYVAQTERENIRKRQAEGIAAARDRGVHMGRKKREMPPDFVSAVRDWRDNRCSLAEIMTKYNVSRSYVYKKYREMDMLMCTQYRGQNIKSKHISASIYGIIKLLYYQGG